MNRQELKEIFVRNSVPKNVIYELKDTNIGDLLGIDETIAGWRLYYSERGHKNTLEYFETEDEACRALLREVSRQMKKQFNVDMEI
jgi:hypothetical protein